MSSATPDYAEIAQRMLAHEAAETSTVAGCALAVRCVHQKLHHRMVPLIGVSGMRALFARSIKVTGAALPRSAEKRAAEPGGQVDDADLGVQLIHELPPSAAWATATALYANFLGLTSALIGERLVVLVLQRAFPKIDVTAKQESE